MQNQDDVMRLHRKGVRDGSAAVPLATALRKAMICSICVADSALSAGLNAGAELCLTTVSTMEGKRLRMVLQANGESAAFVQIRGRPDTPNRVDVSSARRDAAVLPSTGVEAEAPKYKEDAGTIVVAPFESAAADICAHNAGTERGGCTCARQRL
jgi:hypothetical protein